MLKWSPETASDNRRRSYLTWTPDTLHAPRYFLFCIAFIHTKDFHSVHFSRSSVWYLWRYRLCPDGVPVTGRHRSWWCSASSHCMCYSCVLKYAMFLKTLSKPALSQCIVLTIRAFYKRRRHLQALLSDHGTMNTNRYIRLMCVAGVAMLVTIPLVSSSLSVKVSNIQPWISWKDTHWHFSNINIYPANVWRRNSTSEGRMEVNRWVFIIPSVIFFAFFGFAEEARHNYRVAFWRVVGWLGYARKPLVTPNGYGSLLSISATTLI